VRAVRLTIQGAVRQTTNQLIRRRLDLRGQVQGVGFRPFVYRLASEQALSGYVANNNNGVVIEIEGPAGSIEAFEESLALRLPPLARIFEVRRAHLEPRHDTSFRIERSERGETERAEVTPDAATCDDCVAELFDPAGRRHRYPFINCTNCGPRYSIIRAVPYDRPATTMVDFRMCAPCNREYTDPSNRRFHAQPNACAVCGPELRLHPADACPPGDDAIARAARLLGDGRILAIKGIGGYHLACRADREDVVQRLRERKLRDGKPLAIMVPNVDAAERVCRLTAEEIEILGSPAAPILLAPKRANHGVGPSVAPNCSSFGIMLPYAPVHYLLFAEGLGPLVMTSANLAGQPLTYEDEDALATLGDVADAFLVHNRAIFRPIDDSVVFAFRGAAVPIRRARGYAPRPLRLGGMMTTGRAADVRVLAVGGELKATVCLWANGEATISEHLGDLTSADAFRHFVRAIDRLKTLFQFDPQLVAHDLHPQYLSTGYARRLGLPTVAVQHHHAHVVSAMAEWGEVGPVVGIACDGAGHGTDGAVWGCEVLRCTPDDFERLGHLDYYPQVGGDAAAIETWRPAAALLRQACGDEWRDTLAALASRWIAAPAAGVLDMFERQAVVGLNAPRSSSLGRVFDAISFLLGLCERNRHEAEAAMALEAAAASGLTRPYSFDAGERDGRIRMSLIPAITEIVADVGSGKPVASIAARFHETVARMLAEAAAIACELSDIDIVALSGGCFANRILLTRLVELLEQRRVRVLHHREVPCGDGGIALGQAVAAAWRAANEDQAADR
jgi:hydrogenase maturation protein HypF